MVRPGIKLKTALQMLPDGITYKRNQSLLVNNRYFRAEGTLHLNAGPFVHAVEGGRKQGVVAQLENESATPPMRPTPVRCCAPATATWTRPPAVSA